MAAFGVGVVETPAGSMEHVVVESKRRAARRTGVKLDDSELLAEQQPQHGQRSLTSAGAAPPGTAGTAVLVDGVDGQAGDTSGIGAGAVLGEEGDSRLGTNASKLMVAGGRATGLTAFEDSVPPDPADMFEVYKRSDGAGMLNTLEENKAQLRKVKESLGRFVESANRIRRIIDQKSRFIDKKKLDRLNNPNYQSQVDEGGEVIEEDEYEAYQEMKAAKTQHRAAVEECRRLRQQLVRLGKVVETSRTKFLQAFQHWYETMYGEKTDKGKKNRLRVDSTEADTVGRRDVSHRGQAALGEDDVLDDGEQFDRLEMARVVGEDVDSLPFFRARKYVERTAGRRKRISHTHKRSEFR